MDYRRYRLGMKEKLLCLAGSGALTALVAWLFYRSLWGLILLPAVYIVCRKRYEEAQQKKRTEQLLCEFKDTMQAVSAALLAGYSMENAWREAEKELMSLCGQSCLMLAEVHRMNEAVRMNEPLEKVLSEFAERSGCEEIESFAEVFSFAKRSGGDFARIIRTTTQKLVGRMEVEREIATVLAGKKLEGRIMNLMPLGILAYLTFTSGDFLASLYGNVLGIVIMSMALGIYLAAIRLSEHILDIQV